MAILAHNDFMLTMEVNMDNLDELTNQEIFDLHDTYLDACEKYQYGDMTISLGSKNLQIIECYENNLTFL